MTEPIVVFRPVAYPEDPQARRFQRVERSILNDQIREKPGAIYRPASKDEENRPDSVAVLDPDDFEVRRYVPA